MSKKTLSERMNARTPLHQRQAVEPVNMYTNPQVDKPTNGEDSSGTSPQVDMSPRPQVHETTSPQVGKPTSGQVHKYTTHLRQETIKAVKRAAFDRECKDYEIVQQALDAYLREQRG